MSRECSYRDSERQDGDVVDRLQRMGFDKHRINRSLKLYARHYNVDKIGWDIDTVTEIIFRLKIKDQLKKTQRKFSSKVSLIRALEAMEFRTSFINIAIEKYEFLMRFKSTSAASIPSGASYDIQRIATLIMQIRARQNNRKPLQRFSCSSDLSSTPRPRDVEERKQSRSVGDRIQMTGYYAGTLYKQSSRNRRKWQKRYFIVDNGELQYFKDAEKARCYFERNGKNVNRDRKEYIGDMAVCKVTKLCTCEDRPFVLSVTTPLRRTYLLQANNQVEYEKWFACLCVDIVKTRNSVDVGVNVTSTAADMNHMDERQSLYATILQHNPICADCSCPCPEWVSINIGVVLCLQCCGIHRELGCNVSKIRSLTLDNLDIDVLRCIVNIGGNQRLNEGLLEYSLNKSHKIHYKTCSIKERTDFIYDKYARKSYIYQKFDNTTQLMQLMHQHMYDSVMKNDCFGVVLALFNGADIDHKFKQCNDVTVLQTAILLNKKVMVQCLINNNATPILQI
mmetsp:Transcript_2699/g.5108  ORF Transcript_2699/g.5108 Transcript_2699/m.5108 type:complete len:508 (-) Transcript_2699:99-1622(-)|eukprot:CAMPEP_0202695498 /NCGR_PEP_ID=MMETSP1385-20130828/9076_1 /ASSEMBLY_ACC=CAM_ASM_000861 /TAXON_ID=933848 /ORGANISM="Elphidium margaritaceum" /LENGTH=507 /DNA_ID=CAMNT_0049351533 /DNA_START=23 /DNA_END=1546 /DNA_ORIENTATION=-